MSNKCICHGPMGKDWDRDCPLHGEGTPRGAAILRKAFATPTENQAATIAELRERLADAEKLTEQLYAKMTCMCGLEIDHGAWEGHSPVSMYDHALEAAEARAAAAERALVEVIAAQDETYPMPKHGWTCFFCGETFKTPGAAQDHFGGSLLSLTACQIKASEERGLVMALRKAEAELIRYRAEDSDTDRKFYAIQADHAIALGRAEEEGYNKAVSDMNTEKAALTAQNAALRKALEGILAITDRNHVAWHAAHAALALPAPEPGSVGRLVNAAMQIWRHAAGRKLGDDGTCHVSFDVEHWREFCTAARALMGEPEGG